MAPWHGALAGRDAPGAPVRRAGRRNCGTRVPTSHRRCFFASILSLRCKKPPACGAGGLSRRGAMGRLEPLAVAPFAIGAKLHFLGMPRLQPWKKRFFPARTPRCSGFRPGTAQGGQGGAGTRCVRQSAVRRRRSRLLPLLPAPRCPFPNSIHVRSHAGSHPDGGGDSRRRPKWANKAAPAQPAPLWHANRPCGSVNTSPALICAPTAGMAKPFVFPGRWVAAGSNNPQLCFLSKFYWPEALCTRTYGKP